MHHQIQKNCRSAGCYTILLFIATLAFTSLAKTDVPVFLLSGQSNMTGYAAAADLTADQKKNVDNVKIYMDLVWEGDASKLRKWLTLGPGFGSNINNIGPELYLGRMLSEAMPGKKIAFIKCSSGSTFLGKVEHWLPPSSNNGVGGDLYKRMMNSVNVALKAFNTAFDTSLYTPRWAGFVWLQGEFDAGDIALSNAYEKNLTNLIKDIRASLKTADLPVIIPMIDAQSRWANYAIIRAAEIKVAEALTNVDTLDTKGFVTDGAHYKGQGQVKIGTIAAARWLAMNYQYSPAVPVVSHRSPSTVPYSAAAKLSPDPLMQFDLSGRLLKSTNGSTGKLSAGVRISAPGAHGSSKSATAY